MPLCLQKHCHLTTLYADAGQPKDHWDKLMRGDQGFVPILQCCGMRPVRASTGRETPNPFDVECEYWCRPTEGDRKNASRVLKLFRSQFQARPMHRLSRQILPRQP